MTVLSSVFFFESLRSSTYLSSRIVTLHVRVSQRSITRDHQKKIAGKCQGLSSPDAISPKDSAPCSPTDLSHWSCGAFWDGIFSVKPSVEAKGTLDHANKVVPRLVVMTTWHDKMATKLHFLIKAALRFEATLQTGLSSNRFPETP